MLAVAALSRAKQKESQDECSRHARGIFKHSQSTSREVGCSPWEVKAALRYSDSGRAPFARVGWMMPKSRP